MAGSRSNWESMQPSLDTKNANNINAYVDRMVDSVDSSIKPVDSKESTERVDPKVVDRMMKERKASDAKRKATKEKPKPKQTYYGD